MYSQLHIGIFDLEAAYAHPDTVVGHPGHPGWTPPEQRAGFGFHRTSSFAAGRRASNNLNLNLTRGSINGRTSMRSRTSLSRTSTQASRGSAASLHFDTRRDRDSTASSVPEGLMFRRLSSANFNVEEDDEANAPYVNREPVDFCTQAEDFIGHVVVDICRLRPGSTYDVTLPLRRSKHVFTREPQGSVRIRLHLEWNSERAAVLSYLPRSLGGTVRLHKTPNTRNSINCVDDRAARNIAHAVHGIHMPGKFDMTLMKSTLREIHWTRIHLFRYCKNREIYHLVYWVYPSISGFVFLAWMHAVYFDTVRYVPGHVVVFFLLHLLKNYAYYAMDSPLQNGFVAPSLEELYWALVSGTKKRKKPCIEPLTVEREADPMALTASDHARLYNMNDSNKSHSMDELYDESGNLVHVSRFSLAEIAEAMKKSLKTKPHRKGFTVFKHTFQGDEAVDFLLVNGFATTRPEAISVGRRLEREKVLFQHITKDSMFEDSPYIYCFLDNVETDSLVQTAREPGGARLMELLGFYSRKDGSRGTNQKKGKARGGGAYILESQEHVEFPFATGVDHPRFTVKESLVIRSAEEKSRLKKEDEARAIMDGAEFGIVPSSRSSFVQPSRNNGEGNPGGYASEGGLNRGSQRNLLSGGSEGGAMPRRGSALVGALANGATAVKENLHRHSGARNSAGQRNSGSSRGRRPRPLLEVALTRQQSFLALKEQNNATLNKALELQRKADQYDPYQYDSDNDVKSIQKKKRKKHVILEKHLKKPISQEIGNIESTAVDMSLAKSLEKTKKHVSGIFYHCFDDQVYKIDKNVFPIKMETNTDAQDKKKKKKRGLFKRAVSETELKEEEERQKKLQMTPYEIQQDELDKVLLM
jgi:hypothetical protein